MRGVVLIALFHGISVTIVLFVLRVPLAAALGVLIFLGSFIPIIGLTVTGTLRRRRRRCSSTGSRRPSSSPIAIIVLIQLEAHLLQPLIMSRSVEVHPLAIALSVLTGTILAGIPGALLAVPLVAFLNATVHALRAHARRCPSGDAGFPVAGGASGPHDGDADGRAEQAVEPREAADVERASALADVRLDERRADDPTGCACRARRSRPRSPSSIARGGVDQRQRDALLQRRRERPAGHLADRRAGSAEHGHVGTRDAALERLEAPQQPARAVLLLGDQRVPSPERVLLPPDRPGRARLHRGDRQRQVLAVQRVPRLGAQRVARAETGRAAAERCCAARRARPTAPACRPSAGSARSRARRCSRCGRRAPARPSNAASRVGHVALVRQAARDRSSSSAGARALHREHAEVAVLVHRPRCPPAPARRAGARPRRCSPRSGRGTPRRR